MEILEMLHNMPETEYYKGMHMVKITCWVS